MSKCLYCYKITAFGKDFHSKCSKSFFGTEEPPKILYSLSEMSDLAKNVIERSISVPGVQPKLSMSVFNEDGTDKRLTVVGALDGNYIFKPPSDEFEEMPANEHVTMKIAEIFDIKIVPHSLIRLASGELSYITKRIDRADEDLKIHMIDMFQITEAFDKYRSSMERVGKAIEMYAENILLDQLRLFELVIFSFLTGNNDMHLKNFSMIKNKYGWSLAPAYDLLNVSIVNPDDKEELALTLAGKKRKFNKEHFIAFGLGLGLNKKQLNGVFKRFKKNAPKVKLLIAESFLSENKKEDYIDLFNKRFDVLFSD